jgi:hypothetical protein
MIVFHFPVESEKACTLGCVVDATGHAAPRKKSLLRKARNRAHDSIEISTGRTGSTAFRQRVRSTHKARHFVKFVQVDRWFDLDLSWPRVRHYAIVSWLRSILEGMRPNRDKTETRVQTPETADAGRNLRILIGEELN